MKNIINTLLPVAPALCAFLLISGMILWTTSATYQRYPGNLDSVNEQTIIPKLKSFKGDVFHNFAEFRVQESRFNTVANSSFNTVDIIMLWGKPYTQMINVTYIIKVMPFEDGKGTFHSSLIYITEDRANVPILVREEYSAILKRIRKATELK
jgi:hypothetical protein